MVDRDDKLAPRSPIDKAAAAVRGLADLGLELVRVGRAVSDPVAVAGALRFARRLVELSAPDRPLGRFLAADDGLDAALAPGGPIDRAIEVGMVDRLLGADGLLERTVAPGGLLDQVQTVEESLRTIVPMLRDLTPTMQVAMDVGSALQNPLRDITDSLFGPPRRRRPNGPAGTAHHATPVDGE